ncbi:MAG: hypothetical protein HN403_04370 [Rhodospirillales bacterium]|nr:hypothetical protein [Rhodospirillales bacterium]
MDEFQNTDQSIHEAAGSSTTGLFLALYLLVLAFFMVLVTISSPEDVKSKAVMDSLTSTFSSLLPPTTDLTAFVSREGDMLAGQAFQEEVTGIFASDIQVAKAEIVQPGKLMRVIVPADALFLGDTAEVREGQIPLLDRIVASLSAGALGLRHDMEFVIGSPFTSEKNLPTGETLETARAGAFVRAMHARGVPPESVSIGLKPGNPAEIILRFFVRTQEEVRLKFEEAVEKQPSRGDGQ